MHQWYECLWVGVISFMISSRVWHTFVALCVQSIQQGGSYGKKVITRTRTRALNLVDAGAVQDTTPSMPVVKLWYLHKVVIHVILVPYPRIKLINIQIWLHHKLIRLSYGHSLVSRSFYGLLKLCPAFDNKNLLYHPSLIGLKLSAMEHNKAQWRIEGFY